MQWGTMAVLYLHLENNLALGYGKVTSKFQLQDIVYSEDSDGMVLIVGIEFIDERGNHLKSSAAFDLGNNDSLVNELYKTLLIDPLTGTHF